MDDLIAAIISGLIGGSITQLVMSRRRYKYHWKCPVCQHFSIDANSQDIIDRVKAVHVHEPEEGFPTEKSY